MDRLCSAFVYNEKEEVCQLGFKEDLDCSQPKSDLTVTTGIALSEAMKTFFLKLIS